MSNQLVKRDYSEGYRKVFPKTFIDAIKDRDSGMSLAEILQSFNMYFLSYNGNKALTRCSVPHSLRKEGLWITYVLYDHTVITEWYNSDNIDDESFGSDDNWRQASNMLVGDISISADGYWVVEGKKTSTKAQGETGVTPLLRFGDNNKLQASYNEGKEWEDISGDITNNLKISKYIGINEALPTSGIAEGTIYMKGPYYDENDTNNNNPIYRMWVYAWKGNTLAWQDNGEFTSISAGVVQETGNSTTQVMSQDAVTRELTELSGELGTYEESGEYIRAYTDKNGVFLWGIKTDGSIEFAKGIPSPIKKYVEEKFNGVGDTIELLSIIYSTPSENVENNLEITLDSENKKVSWRSMDGVKHENKMFIENNLGLSKVAMSAFIQSLVDSGFTTKIPMDFSDKSSINLPLPRHCAVVNVISPIGLATSKGQDIRCEFEYLDKSGNYFRKPCILNAQGTSSMAYIEKNQGIDIYNDEAREESCDIIFGNWVAQDSFHWKCYYIDVFRGVCNIAYNWVEKLIKSLDSRNNRIIKESDSITAFQSSGDFATDFGDCALCHPDGFPFEMYVNGEYYGLFAWNLKKHRANYSMNKKDYSAILLDGFINKDTLFGGNVQWTQFELRNPKDLVTMNGSKYDGENPQELIDNTSSAYNSNNATHVNTSGTKNLIKRIAGAMPQIMAASNDDAKLIFEQYFDKKAMIAYFIGANVLYHYDGFSKNWIWTIYNQIAAPTFYDMDSIFGRDANGLSVPQSTTSKILGANPDETITGQLVRLYKEEIDAAYKFLRENNIISVATIMSYVDSWLTMATNSALRRNIEKWPSIPSYRSQKTIEDGTSEGGMFDSPTRIKKWLESRITNLDKYFNYSEI